MESLPSLAAKALPFRPEQPSSRTTVHTHHCVCVCSRLNYKCHIVIVIITSQLLYQSKRWHSLPVSLYLSLSSVCLRCGEERLSWCFDRLVRAAVPAVSQLCSRAQLTPHCQQIQGRNLNAAHRTTAHTHIQGLLHPVVSIPFSNVLIYLLLFL